MLQQFSSKISVFCLTILVGIILPATSGGITTLNVNKYQEASDLGTNSQIHTLPKSIQIPHNSCQQKTKEPVYLAQSIICQRQLDANTLLRRISYPNQGCVDEIVDINSGYILQTNPAPCDPNC